MKPAKACQQCRVSKRKCVSNDNVLHQSCLPCQSRNIRCSKTLVFLRIQPLAPSPDQTPGSGSNVISTLSHELIAEFVGHYLRFIHDRPHSIFHEKTLWDDLQKGNLATHLLTAICALGCRFSKDPQYTNFGSELRAESSSLLAQVLETISLENIHTCILLANLCAIEQNHETEALYFGIANRMANILRLYETNSDDLPVLQEIKCRTWWTLFMADRWCPPSLGLPREMPSTIESLDFPMDEGTFQGLDISLKTPSLPRDEGLWKFMITLVDILGPVQDLNHALVRNTTSNHDIEQQVEHLAGRLNTWITNLPAHVVMNEGNLDAFRYRGHGGTFIALHFGYHHYCTLLYFQYLESIFGSAPQRMVYAQLCRHHALSFSKLLRKARQMDDCQVVYITVAHMTMVSSSVLLHLLLFGNDDEVQVAREHLTSNFEALIELGNYWPHMDKVTQRLLSFQTACLQSTNSKTHNVDRWMVRFLLEHALPLGSKAAHATGSPSQNEFLSPSDEYPILSERTIMLDEAFADLRR